MNEPPVKPPVPQVLQSSVTNVLVIGVVVFVVVSVGAIVALAIFAPLTVSAVTIPVLASFIVLSLTQLVANLKTDALHTIVNSQFTEYAKFIKTASEEEGRKAGLEAGKAVAIKQQAEIDAAVEAAVATAIKGAALEAQHVETARAQAFESGLSSTPAGTGTGAPSGATQDVGDVIGIVVEPPPKEKTK